MSQPPDTDDARRDAGMATRREVLGDAHVDRAVAATTPLTADFQDFITRTAWGDVWQRPGLARRDRSLLTLAITIALRHWDEFALHVRAAKNNGLSDEEIAEVIQHAAIYAGVPAANHAFAVARPILDSTERETT
jgi:4-carboxymuconolactone decarboxylase